MADKLSIDFLKRLGSAKQLEGLKNLGNSGYNTQTNKLNESYDPKILEGDLAAFKNSELSQVFSEEELENLFKIIDADGNGEINADEAKNLAKLGEDKEDGKIDNSDLKTLFENAQKFVKENTIVETHNDGSRTVTTTAEDGSQTTVKYDKYGEIDTTPTIDGSNIQVNTDKVILTDSGKLGRLVKASDLPDGYSIKNGKILDSLNNEIGSVNVKEADIDGDGVVDSIESYYLYMNANEHQVAETSLPEYYRIRGNKILDANGYEIGRTETQEFDAGDGDIKTYTKYYLYDSGSTMININGNTAYAAKKEGLPEGSRVENNIIYNKYNQVIGVVKQLSADINGDGTMDTIDEYYRFPKPLESPADLEAKPNSQTTQETTEVNQIVRTESGKFGKLTKQSELPEGYEIKNNRIINYKGEEIGAIVASHADVDGDGIIDSVNSYYLYMAPKDHAVAESNLPENYRIRGNKILDANGYEIGRVEKLNLDLGNGDVRTVKKYYLYDSGSTMINIDGRTAYATQESNLPKGYYVKDGIIYNSKNRAIGIVKTTQVDVNGDGVLETIEEFYRYA